MPVASSFFPPLYLQRRKYILETLKEEKVRSALELGCGEGAILSSLCHPAASIDALPTELAANPSFNSNSLYNDRLASLNQVLAQTTSADAISKDLHLERLAGLDVDENGLARAIFTTDPGPQPFPNAENDISGLSRDVPRWNELTVQLWHGSLDIYNDSLQNYEAFIATEVVEHLHQPVLSQFGRVILGRYNPRIAIVTTPDYDFHEHFPQGDPNNSFPDPTQRTSRIFRNADHKLEMTGEEFRTWATDLALQHDYDVTFGGVGDLSNYKLLPEPTGQFATQCAVFRRRPETSDDRGRSPRSPKVVPLPFFLRDDGTKQTSKTEHKLLKTHTFPAWKEAGKPKSPQEIVGAVTLVLERMGARQATLRELWSRNVVSKACGGLITKLLEALVEDQGSDWEFSSITGTGSDAIVVLCKSMPAQSQDIEVEANGAPPTEQLPDADWPQEIDSHADKKPKLAEEDGGWQ